MVIEENKVGVDNSWESLETFCPIFGVTHSFRDGTLGKLCF